MISQDRFDQLLWHEDRFELGGLTFRLDADWSLPHEDLDCFWLFKGTALLDEYEAFFKKNPITVRNLMELGIWETASIAFWHEIFKPDKHIAIDLSDARETPYYHAFIRKRGLAGRVKTYWNTDQADAGRLLSLWRRDFNSQPLDLVIDDASHFCEPTKASFATLFPVLREGGIYIIEDWLWEEGQMDTAAAGEPGLQPVIAALRGVHASRPDVIAALDERVTFVGLRRGPASEKEARSALEAALSPRYQRGPSAMMRLARRSRLWPLARRAKQLVVDRRA